METHRSYSPNFAGRDVLAAAALGLLGVIGFLPMGLFPLYLVSISLLLLLLRDMPPAKACGLTLVYGFVYGLGTMHWFFDLYSSTLTLIFLCIFAAYFGLLGVLISSTRRRSAVLRAVLVALFAVALDWLRGDAWYLRFPWYTAAHALAAEPSWIAPTRWVGTYGLTYLAWLAAGLGAFVRPWYWLSFVLLPASAWLLPAPAPADCQALVVQGERSTRHVESVVAGLVVKPVDLVVLPEFAYDQPPLDVLKADLAPSRLARACSCPVVFGTLERSSDDWRLFHNVAAVIGANGELIGTFPKQHPVPIVNDGLPGERRPVFPVARGTLGVAVCYDFDASEVAASLVEQGATVFVDSMMDPLEWGKMQHLHHGQILRLRAVENDRWLVRAASSGRSEAIDPLGRPSLEGVEIGESGTAIVGFSHRNTYALGGVLHVLGPGAALAAVVVLGLQAVGRILEKRSTTNHTSPGQAVQRAFGQS